jgi:hypothetical protein
MLMAIQILGSIAILAAFGLAQVGVLNQKSVIYLVINIIGALLLGINALIGQQWGFVLLEVSWLGVAVVGLFNVLFRKKA